MHEITHQLRLTRRGLARGFLAAVAVLTAAAVETSAAGRKGSRRVGGTNSAGKGSKYVGGKKK